MVDFFFEISINTYENYLKVKSLPICKICVKIVKSLYENYFYINTINFELPLDLLSR